MKKSLLIGLLTLVIVAPLLIMAVQKVLASPDPTVGLGYIYDVTPSGGMEIPGSKKWKVQQGATVTVTLKEVELATVDVWVKGSYTSGSTWTIQVLDDYTVGAGGTVVFSFTVPATAGCTMQVSYKDIAGGESHEAAVYSASAGKQSAGGLKAYDSDWNYVPCVGVPAPEFSMGSAVATSIGLIAAFAVRRRYQKK